MPEPVRFLTLQSNFFITSSFKPLQFFTDYEFKYPYRIKKPLRKRKVKKQVGKIFPPNKIFLSQISSVRRNMIIMFYFQSTLRFRYKWDEVFKNGPSKICGRQPLKNLKQYGLIEVK